MSELTARAGRAGGAGVAPRPHLAARAGAWLRAARRALAARRAEALAAALLVLTGANLLSALPRKSITNDEIVHIPAGYYHLVDGNFQINNEHPPLAKMWAALPLLVIQPEEPDVRGAGEENYSERTWRYLSAFWPDNASRFEAISFWTRAMMVVPAAALGLVVFLFARRLFGSRAALFAAALYAFEPTVLAHGRVVHTDVPAALAYLVYFVALCSYAGRPGARRALLVGLACGVAMATKFSMVVLLPLTVGAALLAVARPAALGRRRRLVVLDLALAVAAVWLVVNSAYYFRDTPVSPADVEWVRTKSPEAFGRWMDFFAAGSRVAPTYYLFGLYNVVIHNRDGHAASLLGMHSDAGWWYYFPVAFALKTSLPFLFVSALALVWSLWRLCFRRDGRFLFVAAPVALYAAFSLTSHINIGVRHLLPAYPFLFVAGGALLDRLSRARRRRAPALAAVALALGWGAFEAARAYPDYVPYMNQLASSRPHWWYLSDSNVEWGDDVKALAEYLKARGETQVRGALAGAWGTMHLYGVRNLDLIAPADVVARYPPTRYTAVGASFLNGSTVAGGDEGEGQGHGERRVNKFADYRDRRPEAVFGGSIYLYREGE